MYDHTMNANITFKNGVTIEAAVIALTPLMRHFSWTREQILEQSSLGGQDFVQIYMAGVNTRSMVIHTCGDVGDSYRSVLIEFAGNLSTLAEPGQVELSNHDTADLEHAIEKIWYGEPAAVTDAQLKCAWLAASDALRAAAVPESTLTFFEQCLKTGVDNASGNAAEKATRADDAKRYFDELQSQFGGLIDIGAEFGNDTVRDLFYVHSAILSDSYVEHFKKDSQLLEVLEQLPSARTWTAFVSLP